MKAGRLILSALIAAGCIFSSVGCSGEKSSVGNVEQMNFVDGDVLAEITFEEYGTVKAKLFPDLCPNAVQNFRMLAEKDYYDGLRIHRVLENTVIQGGSLLGDGTGEKALINEEGTFDVETDVQARHFYGALCCANTNGKNATQFFIVNNKEPQDLSQYDPEQVKVAAAAYGELKASAEEGSPEYEENAYKEAYYTMLAAMLSDDETNAAFIYKQMGGLPLFDGGYTVFGQIYEGFEVLEAISKVELQKTATGELSKPVNDIIISDVVIIDYKAPTTAEATAEADKKNNKDDKDDKAESKDAASAEASTGEAVTDEASTAEAASAEASISTLEAEETVQSE